MDDSTKQWWEYAQPIDTEQVRARLVEQLRAHLAEVEKHHAFIEWANFDTRSAGALLDSAPLDLLGELAGDICAAGEDGAP